MSSQRLVILYTNDIHSHFEQMPKIASVFTSFRAAYPQEELLIVDCGDHMDRMRLETEGSQGIANIAVMNASGYEAAVPGNNEGLTFTSDILRNAYENHAAFPVLGSNLRKMDTQRIPPWLKPYLILRKKDLRIGLIGVTIPYRNFYKLLGWDVDDPLETVGKWVRFLRPQVDVIIVLSHLGLPGDKQLAAEIEGIDCILGAHTHHLLEKPLLIDGTLVCGAGKFGEYVGMLEVQFDFKERRLEMVKGECIDVSTFADDVKIASIIRTYREKSEMALERKIAHLDQPLPVEWGQESPLGNLLAAGVRKWVGADIGLVNAGQFLEGLREGSVTERKLLEICPSPINPCRILLKGKHIWQALEEALLPEFIYRPIRGFGFRGKVLGTICLDGLQVEFDPSREDYHKIMRVWVNGSPLGLNRTYSVGTLDMFTFGIGYTSLSQGKDVAYFLPEFIRDVLVQQLTDPEEIQKSKTARWIKV